MAQEIDEAVRALMRPSAAVLDPYDPAFSPTRINLSANENTYGMPSAVREEMLRALAAVTTNRYPLPMSDALRAEIAAWHGVEASQVIVGNGGDELLYNLFLAFGGPGHTLVNCPPTFSVYGLYARLAECEVLDVWREPETFAPNVDALVEAARAASLVVVTSPNNPTGDLFPLEGVRALCEACPGIVLVDEAYGEFAEEGASAEPLMADYPNLAILHTFSKAFCLAGGRVGYVLASRSVVGALSAVRQPYSVNAFSQAAALVAARKRSAFEPTIATIRRERGRLEEALGRLAPLGVTVWPSQSNFLCVRMPDAHQVRCRLRDDFSILVRDFSADPGLKGCLRMTVGTPQENDAVIAALQAILSKEA